MLVAKRPVSDSFVQKPLTNQMADKNLNFKLRPYWSVVFERTNQRQAFSLPAPANERFGTLTSIWRWSRYNWGFVSVLFFAHLFRVHWQIIPIAILLQMRQQLLVLTIQIRSALFWLFFFSIITSTESKKDLRYKIQPLSRNRKSTTFKQILLIVAIKWRFWK